MPERCGVYPEAGLRIFPVTSPAPGARQSPDCSVTGIPSTHTPLMPMKAVAYFLTVVLGILLLPPAASAQDDKPKRDRRLFGSNSEGTHFIVGFMQNEADNCTMYGQRQIMIASRFNARVVVTAPNGGILYQAQLQPFDVRSVEIDRWYECIGEGVFNNAINVVSDVPISVYCFNSQLTTTEGYLALPVNSWGTQYVAPSYAVDQYDIFPPEDSLLPRNYCLAAYRGGEIAVIASEDNTTVSVYPRARTANGVPAGGIVRQTIRRGQIYQIQDGGRRRGGSDLTGSIIVADKPVGVLSGHVRAAVPVSLNTKDHLIEMIPPRNTLGSRYFAIPYGGRGGGDEIRVISASSSPTEVVFTSQTGTSNATIVNAGDWVSYDLRTITVITSSQPVLVTHYSRSTMADPANRARPNNPPNKFDPYMVVLTPEEQFVNAAVFQTLPNYSTGIDYPPQDQPQFNRHYVTIVGETKNFSTITMDDQPMASQPEYQGGVIPNTDYSWASLRVSDGAIHVLQGDALFGGYVYGLGTYDSYGWPVGAGLRKFDVPDNSRPILAARSDCNGPEIIVRDSGAFESGLLDAWLDTAASTNMRFNREFIIRGDEYSLGRLTLIDPTLPGYGVVIAEDLAGNRDTIEVDFAVTSPEFDRDSVFLFDIRPGDSVGLPVAVMNTSVDTMRFTSARLATGLAFKLAYTPGATALPLQGGISMPLYFKASTIGTYRDTLIVECNCQTYRIPLLALMGVPSINTHDLDYGTLRRGRDSCMTLHVENTGNAPLRIDSAVLEGMGFRIALDLPYPVIVAPDRDTTLTVCFEPAVTGLFTGTVSFHSNADSVAVAHLRGRAVYPALTVGDYDYGRIQAGEDSCALVPIANTGDDSAHLTGLSVENGTIFRADTAGVFPHTLAPLDTLWVRICFRPDAEGNFTAGISPRNTDGLETQGALRGSGYLLRVSIDGYDWKGRWVGSTNDTVVYLHNHSVDPVTITRVWLDSGDLDVFSIPTQPSLPVVLAANDSMPVPVRFAPLIRGDRNCLIHGATSSSLTPVVTNTLHGLALHAAVEDSLTMATEAGFRCLERTGTLAMLNTGNVPLTLAELSVTSVPAGSVAISGLAAGEVIAPGEGRTATLRAARADVATQADVVWRFQEIPDTNSRTVLLPAGLPQLHYPSAIVPASIGIGQAFDVTMRIDSARWVEIDEETLSLQLTFNPSVAAFDMAEWKARVARHMANGPAWTIAGDPVVEGAGHLRFEFRASPAASILQLVLPPFPFRAYLGSTRNDTVRMTLAAPDTMCVLPSKTAAIYQVDSICGLTIRLFEYTGPPYTLRPISPNPATGSATLNFTLGMEAATRIELLSTTGSVEAVLFDGTLPAGDHLLDIDLRAIPSGIYYCRLTSGPFTGTQQLVVTQ